ncbi:MULTISPECIES: helix-turn-helix transcriptional regulator [unclassified Streptomyces]|uniref:helix-turn-helix transcriptional regulator n=1 Tax=Streptomyces sp. NPDC052179 TaxID=3155680 RepID=UPI003417A079
MADAPEDVHRVDSVEGALLQARALIESSMSMHRRQPGGASLLVRADDGSVVEAVKRVMAGARYSAHLAVTGNWKHSSVVIAAVAAAVAPPPAPHGRGQLAVRLLAAGRALELSADCRQAFGDTTLEVRMSKGELREALIVDGRTALVQSGNGSAGRHAAVISDPAAVGALDLLFAGAWANARPVADELRLDRSLRGALARRILEQLRAGRTDDVAAREIDVSLRTYRRHVAEIMRVLGANSRFQAGVRAVELGLLERS